MELGIMRNYRIEYHRPINSSTTLKKNVETVFFFTCGGNLTKGN